MGELRSKNFYNVLDSQKRKILFSCIFFVHNVQFGEKGDLSPSPLQIGMPSYYLIVVFVSRAQNRAQNGYKLPAENFASSAGYLRISEGGGGSQFWRSEMDE